MHKENRWHRKGNLLLSRRRGCLGTRNNILAMFWRMKGFSSDKQHGVGWRWEKLFLACHSSMSLKHDRKCFVQDVILEGQIQRS